MRTGKNNFNRILLMLGLSIAAMLDLVNGHAKSLPSVNSDNSSTPPRAKAANPAAGRFIDTVVSLGVDGDIGKNLAPVIGLSQAASSKDVEIIISERDSIIEKRGSFVVLKNKNKPLTELGTANAICAYLVRIKRSGVDKQTRYYRIDLNGNLEKAVLSQGKFDAKGRIIRGSGVKTDLDIDSPEVRKTFDAEMDFWLNDWLKKQAKAPAKKAAGR